MRRRAKEHNRLLNVSGLRIARRQLDRALERAGHDMRHAAFKLGRKRSRGIADQIDLAHAREKARQPRSLGGWWTNGLMNRDRFHAVLPDQRNGNVGREKFRQRLRGLRLFGGSGNDGGVHHHPLQFARYRADKIDASD